MLTLLGRKSSINVRKVMWTCAELNLEFERQDWGIGFKDVNTDEFLALNPNAKIPVLLDGDRVLWESHTIGRYLANRQAPTVLYPQNAWQRAKVDQWIDWQACELNPSWSYAFMSLVRQSPKHQDAAQVQASLSAWTQMMFILNQQLAQTQAYIAGPGFSLADIILGLSVHRWLHTPFDRPKLQATEDYYHRLASRPAFVEHCAGFP
ncbi:glutathione S-transferase family protein [Alcaligenes faecalis]|uniref:glutathione S-transferase family protein n=1 Tax=Alcaligenes faecalis TaxID=511 RepID=UPI002933F3D1|nr:glutathione S-transferase [Alcaligenes faecalis]MDV2115149.1 glutathione S-transferase [Alcaligenes faecalis]